MTDVPPPTEAELKAAFAVIDRAEAHVKAMAEAAGISTPSVYISLGIMNLPRASIRSNRRLFLNHDGKRNLESGDFLYRSVAAELEKVRQWIQPDVPKRKRR